MKRGKKKIKYAPIFRPVNIEVVGIDKERCLHRLAIAHPEDCGGQNPQGDNAHTRIYVRI